MPFLHQIGAASKCSGAPRGWAAPEADLTFNSEYHPATTIGSGMLPMLCTPTIYNVAVTKTFIDGGAGLNVLSIETSAFCMYRSSGSALASLSHGLVEAPPAPCGRSASP